jgi:uncharacterized protein YjdB/Tol biopolymer transport system component
MHRFRLLPAALAVLAAILLVGPYRSQALHRNTPPFLQVTTGSPSAIGDPRFAGRSNVLVFAASGDLLGNGNAASQIFVFDLAGRVKKQQLSLYQITSGAEDSSGPSAAKRGRVVAFHSEADLLGTGSTGRQVFASVKAKWKSNLTPLFQVTRGAGESFDPIVNETGKFLVFSSTDDLLAEGLPGGVHLYRADLRKLPKSTCPGYPCPVEGNPGLARIASAEVEGVTIDKKGQRVAFASRADAAGTGCGTGVLQLFLWSETTGAISQLTCGDADSRNPIFTHTYRGILFESDADLLATGSTRTQIFHLDTLSEPDVLTQMTFGTDGDSTRPAPNGTTSVNRFFFASSAHLTSGATAGIERLYQYSPVHPLQRLTDDQPIASNLTAQFQFAAFVSDGDLVGNGNDEPQLFLVNTAAVPGLDPTPTPTPTATVTPTPTFTAAPTPALVRISLAPAEKTLTVGQTEVFTATGHWNDGSTANVTQLADYQTSAPGTVAAPNAPGNKSQVEAVAPGTATISASYAGVTTTMTGDDATVTVLGALDHIVVAPATTTLSVGEIETYTATGHYVGGGTQNLTQMVDWASSDPDVAAALNTPGNKSQVEAVAPGDVTISATDPGSGISSTDSGDDGELTVIGPLESITLAPASKTLAVGGFETYTATGHYEGGATRNLTQQVTYFSSDEAVAEAPNTPGNRSRVNAVGTGMATIHCEHLATGVVSNDSSLTVIP